MKIIDINVKHIILFIMCKIFHVVDVVIVCYLI